MKVYFVNPKERVNARFLKENGYDSVYLCASKGLEKDPEFEQNYEAVKDSGVKIGFYHQYEAPKRNSPFTVDSCKEGRAFGRAVEGKPYDLPLCLNFKDKNFDKDDFKGAVNAVRNGINGFTQNVDKILGRHEVWFTKTFVIRATAEQMKFIKADPDNSCYKKMIRE